MVYDMLVKLLNSDGLRDKTIVLKDNSIIPGGRVFEVNRSEIRYFGGESSYEEFLAPIEKIAAIRQNEKVIFKRRKRIERVYPRG
jgi:hypothetical protein